MTKYEKKLVSMLNYYEVGVAKNKKDEKMSKKDLNRFLDRFNQHLDFYMLEDIIKKIKGGDKGKIENSTSNDNQEENPLKPFENNEEDDDFEEQDFFLDKTEEKEKASSNEIHDDKILTDINNFLKWLTFILFTGEYSVIVNDDGKTINIKLVRNQKGKK